MASCPFSIFGLAVQYLWLVVPVICVFVGSLFSIAPTPYTDVKSLPKELQEWRETGSLVHLLETNVFAAFHKCDGSTCSGDTVLLVHGFPTSSYDWHMALPHLTPHHNVLLFDLPGFGLSDKPSTYEFSYSIGEYADIIIGLIEKYKDEIKGLHLVCHDMGDTVCQELVFRTQHHLWPYGLEHIKSLTLNNGGMIIRRASLRVSQYLLRMPIIGSLYSRLANIHIFKQQIKGILGFPEAFPVRELELMFESIVYNNGIATMAFTSRYVNERWRFENARWLRALRQLDVDESIYIHVMWGTLDKVAPPTMADALERELPQTHFSRMDDCGHFAMLENPEAWARITLEGIASAYNGRK